MNTDIKFAIETDSKEVLDTGSVIQFENESTVFSIDDLKFRLAFTSDGGKPSIESQVAEDESEMKIMFRNYDNNLGIANSHPLSVATINEKNLYLMIRVATIAGKKANRLIHYTWYLEK